MADPDALFVCKANGYFAPVVHGSVHASFGRMRLRIRRGEGAWVGSSRGRMTRFRATRSGFAGPSFAFLSEGHSGFVVTNLSAYYADLLSPLLRVRGVPDAVTRFIVSFVWPKNRIGGLLYFDPADATLRAVACFLVMRREQMLPLPDWKFGHVAPRPSPPCSSSSSAGSRLFGYQRAFVQWAAGVEREGGCPGGGARRIRDTELVVGQCAVDPVTQRVALDAKQGCVLRCIGAILADEAGLGKTASMLGLVWDTRAEANGAPSLVVCPTHIARQWAAAAADFFSRMRVRVVRSVWDMKRWGGTTEDTDLLVVTSSFLSRRMADYPVLKRTRWRRLILDEGHEVVRTSETWLREICAAARFRWYLSATPFPTDNHVGPVSEFLGVVMETQFRTRRSWAVGRRRRLTSIRPSRERQLWAYIRDHRLHRVTREQVRRDGVDDRLPDVSIRLVPVRLSDPERLVYALAVGLSTDLALRVCAGGKTVQDTLADTAHVLEMRMRHIRVRIESFERAVENQDGYERPPQALQSLRTRLRTLRRTQAKHTALHDTFHSSLLQSREQGERTLERLGATWKEREGISTVTHAQTLRFGRKLAFVASEVSRILAVSAANRVVLFSQFEPTLANAAVLLTELGVGCARLKGNVYVRERALRLFRNRKRKRTDMTNCPKVLLLSSKTASSGTDLTLCTHMFLLDTTTRSDDARARDYQAVSRVIRQCKATSAVVYRVYAVDTVDERAARAISASSPPTG
jgi:SNF2 family DNA or RNA helicase